MNKKNINSHDRFFNVLFSKKEEVSEFVAKTFPSELVQKLNLETLEIDKTDYIDSKLRTNFSDVVYNCKYGKDTNIKIALLFEHKSYPVSFPHLQLLGYMLKIWELQIKQKKDLTPVIPIIFYHGKEVWNNKQFTEYFSGIDNVLEKFIPKFDYQLIDTSDYTDDEIIKLFNNLQLQIGILVMKNIFNEEKILQEINKIFAGLNQLLQTEQGELFFESIVSYLFYATGIDTEKYVNKMRTISTNAGEIFVSTAMKLKTEGIENEKRRVALNLIEKGYSNQIIIDATNLKEDEIEQLRKFKNYQFV